MTKIIIIMTRCFHPIQIRIRFKKIILHNNNITWILSACFPINESVGQIGGLFISSLKLQKLPVFQMCLSISAGGAEPVDVVGCVGGCVKRESSSSFWMVWFGEGEEYHFHQGHNYIKIWNWDTLFVSNCIHRGKFLFIEMT